MTNLEFVEKLKNIEQRKTKYNNHYPYNLCYYDGEYLSADCWNLIKSLIWDNSIDQNYTTGRFANPNYSTGLGDWTVGQMVDACYKADPNSVSEDFSELSKIPKGALLYYYNGSHAGAYVGDGKCIECTTGWSTGKVVYSDVGTKGERTKDGVASGYWSKWAVMPWITYVEEPTEEPVEQPTEEPIEEPIEQPTEQTEESTEQPVEQTEEIVEQTQIGKTCKINWVTLISWIFRSFEITEIKEEKAVIKDKYNDNLIELPLSELNITDQTV